MLWYKGWLETRLRVLFVFGNILFLVGLSLRYIDPPLPRAVVENLLSSLAVLLLFIPVVLGGAGINAPRILFGAAKGLHGSMYFTLSLPVSRLRLLATRAGLGMLETVGVLAALSCVAWFMLPAPRVYVTVSGLFAHWVTVSICISAFYSLSVFFATFLGDQEQAGASATLIIILLLLFRAVSVPASVNIFRAMGQSSPLITHTFPWASMGISLGVAAIMFLAAMRVVQTHEY